MRRSAAVHREVTIPVVIEISGDRRDVVVTYDRSRATVGDLERALSSGSAAAACRLLVDDRCPPPDTPLERAGLRAGDLVRCLPGDGLVGKGHDPPPPAGPSSGVALRVVGGLLAGTVVPLAPGTYLLGRDGDVRLPAPTIASRQARLDVHADDTCTVTDLGTGNPVRVDGVAIGGRARRVPPGALVEVGAVHLQLSRLSYGAPVALPSPEADGTAVLDRPVRRRPAPPEPRVRLPVTPDVQGQARTFGWATLLAPVAFGAVTALLVDPRYALFAALGPVMALAGWAEDRHRGRAAQRDASAAFAAALGRLRHDLHLAASTRLAWCSTALPDPAELVTRAMAGDRRLWERRSGDDDAFRLRVGVATRPWSPVRGHAAAPLLAGDPATPHAHDPITPHRHDPTAPPPHDPTTVHPADSDHASQIAQVLRRWAWLDPAPVAVDLGPGQVIGIAGDRTAALAVARSLILQAAVLHGPADLAVAVAAPDTRRGAWSWVPWLPHTRDTDGRTLLDGPDAVRRLLVGRSDMSAASAGTATAETTQAPHLLVVVDADPESARAIARRHGGATLVVAADPEHLPATCTATVGLDDPHGLATFHDHVTGEQVLRLLVAGMPEATVRDAARALARWRDPERTADDQLPREVPLLDLLGAGGPDADAIADGWRTRARANRLDTPVGSARHGTVTVDLVRDGPHALVAGTTGSGKSELLRSLVLGLATRHSPTRVNFLLIDYKGGSAFDECADLPHTVGVVTDLDGDLSARVLRCLAAELRRRERVLRAAGARDLRDHRPAATGTESLPRLVVAVDEFAALADEVPERLAALVDIAQRGRALGLHLVLATQRPRGVVDDRIRANVDLRIALRVQDTVESVDVLGVPAAARLPRGRRGRALLSVGGDLTTFQAATLRPGA
ncbi:MAG TPA: FtsK/SpoIIIE domain-containing protein, partial [Nitriliruptorales bacterium]|nr:FtsK/SpoIIIE domain-containing protein [Nitriliruptorales bacterium]